MRDRGNVCVCVLCVWYKVMLSIFINNIHNYACLVPLLRRS